MKFDMLVTIFKEDVGIKKENITKHDRLVDDLYMNSLSYMILISSVERRMGINIPIDRIRKIDTVGELYSFVNELCE